MRCNAMQCDAMQCKIGTTPRADRRACRPRAPRAPSPRRTCREMAARHTPQGLLAPSLHEEDETVNRSTAASPRTHAVAAASPTACVVPWRAAWSARSTWQQRAAVTRTVFLHAGGPLGDGHGSYAGQATKPQKKKRHERSPRTVPAPCARSYESTAALTARANWKEQRI